MWLADHVNIDMAVGCYLSRRFKLGLQLLLLGLMLSNCIDFDHAYHIGIDNGFANSLTTHPLHIYGGLLAGISLFLACVIERYQTFFIGLFYGLIIHLSADAIAYFVHYQVKFLLPFGLCFLIALWFILKHYLGKIYLRLYIVAWLYYLIDTFIRFYFYYEMHDWYKHSFWSWDLTVIPMIIYSFVIFAILRQQKSHL